MKRRTVIGATAAAGAVLATGLYRFTDLFVKHYPPTPYDDVLAALVDRGEAAKLGRALAKNAPHGFRPEQIAEELRQRLANRSLRELIATDVHTGRLVEIDGWVVPESVALLSALAAKV